MFSNQFDRARHPLASRTRGIVLGSILMISTAAALVSARTVAVTFWVALASFLLAGLVRRDIDLKLWRPGPVAFSLGAFLLYALLSAAWAPIPSVPLQKAIVVLLVAGGATLMGTLIVNETRPSLAHMGEGVGIGLLFGLMYLLIELLSGQVIKLWLYRIIELRPGDLAPLEYFSWNGNYLLTISKEDLTRNMTDAVLFLWPTVMAIKGTYDRSAGRIGTLALIVLTAAIVALSNHESSKLALVAGFAAFVLARLSVRWAARLVAIAWLTACLAIVPLALLAHRLDVHNAEWLPDSARHRVIIWNYTAERVLARPWVGVGANMTYVLGPELERHSPEDFAQKRTLSTHSHSIYLQTWFELGAVGAVLLSVVGLSILGAIRALAPQSQAYAFATFVSVAAMAASSFGMWQAWFMTSFAFCATLLVLGVQCLESDGRPRIPSSQSTG